MIIVVCRPNKLIMMMMMIMMTTMTMTILWRRKRINFETYVA